METASDKFFQTFSPKFFLRKQFFLHKSSKMHRKSLYDTTHLISNSSITILKATSLNEFNLYFVALFPFDTKLYHDIEQLFQETIPI